MSTASTRKIIFRKEFGDFPKNVNWFPGHMRKARRTVGDELKKVDVFIEVRDARMPYVSHNPMINHLLPVKKKGQFQKIVLFNKMDLANEKRTLVYVDWLRKKGVPAFGMSAKKHVNFDKFMNHVKQKAIPKFKTVGSWMMIGGIPNVGKSTVINTLRVKDPDIKHSRKSGAKVGGVPCITRHISGFKVSENPLTHVIDTPGIIQPIILCPEDGLKLALCGCIRDGILDTMTVADYLLFRLNKNRSFKYQSYYKMKSPTDNVMDLVNAANEKYRKQDIETITIKLLQDFRDGHLGRITLDDEPEVMEAKYKGLLEEVQSNPDKAARLEKFGLLEYM